jgi:Rps23 Pro-64 3,4-dihydroxylase Tpa1-like proline 4-hydroxylase
MIKTIDSVFNKKDILKMFKEINSLNFIRGERDRGDDPNTATGEVAILDKNSFTFKILKKYLSKYKYCNFTKLYRSYVNKFYSNENPYYHTDGKNGYTVLYYVNPEWNLDQQGETQFYLKEEVKGILPIPGRIVIFSSELLHRATSCRSMERYTVALKFNK